MVVAIYVRVSTLDQALEGYSLDAQQRVLRDWCNTRGHSIYRIYKDAGISGKDIKHRPAVCEMLADVGAGKIDCVLVWALSRLTRSVADLYAMWGTLCRNSCDLVSYTEAFDTSTPMGRAMMGLLGVFAQMEREMTAERVAAAMRERAEQGGRTCSCILGYDAIPGGLAINPVEAEIVRSIYEIYEKTGSLSKTAKWCRDKGITGKRGKRMDAYKVRLILTRSVYAGYYGFHELRVRGNMEPLISVERYNRIAEKINNTIAGRKAKSKIILLIE